MLQVCYLILKNESPQKAHEKYITGFSKKKSCSGEIGPVGSENDIPS